MKHLFRGGLLIVMLAAFACAGGNDEGSNPSVVHPGPTDTSGVKTVPPSGDSNVINTDSAGISR